MKIGELNQHCGECRLIDFCGEPYGFCICTQERFAEVEEELYEKIAENAETIAYIGCPNGCSADCEDCDRGEEARDHMCCQIAEIVIKEKDCYKKCDMCEKYYHVSWMDGNVCEGCIEKVRDDYGQ